MPFCRDCGNEIDGAMKFCPHCAAPQDVSPSTQSTNVSHDTVIEEDVPANQDNPGEIATSMVSEAANTSITQSTNAPEEADEVELDPEDTEAEIAYLQNLMENEDSRIRNYARWSLNSLTNPDVLKSKRHKSVTGKITKVASLVFIIALVPAIMGEYLRNYTIMEVFYPITCLSSLIAFPGFILWITWRTNNNSVIIDDVERCAYCNLIIPKDGEWKRLFASESPIQRHWKETIHLRELATTAALMSGEEMGWGMKAKLNFIEND